MKIAVLQTLLASLELHEDCVCESVKRDRFKKIKVQFWINSIKMTVDVNVKNVCQENQGEVRIERDPK